MGKRLGNITKSTPKPAIKINKIPFIIYLINWLKKNGFKKFYFLISFKKIKLEKILFDYFKENKNLKYKTFTEKKRCGTYGALMDNINKFEEKFFYTNADEIAKLDIYKMYKKFLKSKTNVMSSVIKTSNGNLSLNRKKKIVSLVGEEKFNDCGYKFIARKTFKKREKKYTKVEDFLYQDYIKKNDISYYELNELPLRIDTANDIKRTKIKIKK